MRYMFILMGLFILSGVARGEERVGLVHHPLFSPDGEHLVFISERRYNETREYTLSLLTAKRDEDFAITYSLTPRIYDITISPDREITAYLAYDINLGFGIYFYSSNTGEAYGIEWSSSRSMIEKVQFSKDQRYIRFYLKPLISHDGSIGEQFSAAIAGAITRAVVGQWVAMSIKGKPHYTFSQEEQARINWAPIEKPKEIPRFLTQSTPKIKRETQMQWSPDSKSLYLLDETGIWRSDIGKPFIYQWTQIVEETSISRFQLSPRGAYLLYEVASEDEEEQAIWILRVESDSSFPSAAELHKIAKGWGATFSPDENTVFYANLEGFYEVHLNGKKHRTWTLTSHNPNP